MTGKRGTRDWLEKTPKSRFWQLRLTYPTYIIDLHRRANGTTLKTKYLSSRTERYEEARIWSLPRILAHLEGVELIRAHYAENIVPKNFDYAVTPEIAPGQTLWRPDGSRLTASKDGTDAIEFDPAGEIVNNNVPIYGVQKLTFKNKDSHQHQAINKRREELSVERFDIDTKIFDHWSKAQKPERIADAKRTLDLLHKVAPNRSFVTLEPKDARAFITRMVEDGHSTGSMIKKVGALNAMINKALGHEDFRMLKANPFKLKDLIPKGIAGRRTPPTLFNEAELTCIHSDLPNWEHEPRLLFSMLYFMGARLGEPFHVRGEETIEGQRCVSYGTKTAASTARLIPLPPQVLELVPATIEGSLFSSHPDTVTKDMMKRLHALKVPKNSGKSAQSLRHRFVTIGARRRVQTSLVDTITGHVSDDMKGNQGEANRNSRAGVSIHFRYMRGFGPEDLLQAMATIAPIESSRDAIVIDEEAVLKRSS